MADFDKNHAIKLMLEGVDPEDAIASASRLDGNEGYVEWVGEPSGDLDDIPDPSCVASFLSGKDNPTADDLRRALDHCRK